MKKKSRKKPVTSRIIFFYNRKFPEHGIREMMVIDIRWVKSVLTGKELYIHSILSYYDIDLASNTKGYPRIYEVYRPTQDNHVYEWTNHFGNNILMSFDKERLEPFHKADCNTTYKTLKHRMEELEKWVNRK